MMAESNMMVDRDEDYNTRYGGYKGLLLAFERTKLIPRRPAPIDLTATLRAAGADTPEKTVNHLTRRFLSVAPAENDRAVLVEFIRGKIGPGGLPPEGTLEDPLRELLYLVLSMPQYQLG